MGNSTQSHARFRGYTRRLILWTTTRKAWHAQLVLLMFSVGTKANWKSTANSDLVEVFLGHSILNGDLDRLKATIGTTKTEKPIAFIFGHGLWSDLDVPKSLTWLDAILDTIKQQLPHLADSNTFWPRLFVTPNAAGKQKPKE